LREVYDVLEMMLFACFSAKSDCQKGFAEGKRLGVGRKQPHFRSEDTVL
jgi:hypothetical protein